MTQILRRLLRDVDRKREPTYCYDEVTMLAPWPPGALEFFLELGILKEIEPSDSVYLWECEEPEWVEPTWLPHREKGRLIGVYGCGHEWCGHVHEVEAERRRQWAPSCHRIAEVFAKALGTDGALVIDAPGRVCMVGTVTHERQTREVFLVRGLWWKDAASALAGANRLARSANATLLFMDRLPTPEQRQPNWRMALSLAEVVTVNDGMPALPTARLFEDQGVSPLATSPPTSTILTETEADVLEALSENPREPQLVAQLVAASGYGRDSVMLAVKRLVAAGLVERPGGTRRKGVAITERGLQRVGRLPKMA